MQASEIVPTYDRRSGPKYKALCSSSLDVQRYNGLVAESVKVSKAQFEAVIRGLLNTPPLPLADIPRKREPKRKQRKAKQRKAKQGPKKDG